MSHLASIYLFLSKVLKSNSPESSFPSVLLQKKSATSSRNINTQSPSSGTVAFIVRNISVVSFNYSSAVGKCLKVAKQHNTQHKMQPNKQYLNGMSDFYPLGLKKNEGKNQLLVCYWPVLLCTKEQFDSLGYYFVVALNKVIFFNTVLSSSAPSVIFSKLFL